MVQIVCPPLQTTTKATTSLLSIIRVVGLCCLSRADASCAVGCNIGGHTIRSLESYVTETAFIHIHHARCSSPERLEALSAYIGAEHVRAGRHMETTFVIPFIHPPTHRVSRRFSIRPRLQSLIGSSTVRLAIGNRRGTPALCRSRAYGSLRSRSRHREQHAAEGMTPHPATLGLGPKDSEFLRKGSLDRRGGGWPLCRGVYKKPTPRR